MVLKALFEDICKLEKEGKISVNQDLQEQLQSESTKSRHQRNTTPLLSPRLKEAARQLRENEKIIIRKADKSSCYVILDKSVYIEKCRDILQDHSKFKLISRNPTENLKKKLNNLITGVNAEIGGTKFSKLVGDFQPGYFYGNVKTHKENNPLRPIISQISTPSYQVAKILHNIISPYIPTTYSLRSTEEFIDLLNTNQTKGPIASLDAQNLFTEIPVTRTINIILDYVYHHSDLPPPKIPHNFMKALLETCTTEVPFRCPEGKLYMQTDGVSMGSPLGVLFAQAFMAERLKAKTKARTAYVFDMQYADDAAYPALNPQSLQRNLDTVNSIYSAGGLVVNASKTECSQYNTTQPSQYHHLPSVVKICKPLSLSSISAAFSLQLVTQKMKSRPGLDWQAQALENYPNASS
ncbi:uncharacterized protein LOC143019335 [Oratosquilla oratoria]|uniref:uncharacterized protein LOC143019335 n=1 Tax=Oratosquilla oratoria TaxID=337810 RepID=UPI003F75B76C